ncbi:MAG: Spy/CpxP family protein refolding chaperone [Candidatus Methylomirabilaceae bacterium]
MRKISTGLLILAGLLASALTPGAGRFASADDGWDAPRAWTKRWHHMLPDMMRGMGMPDPWVYGRGGHERPLITMMLHWKEQLGLTPDQERSLRALRANFEKEAIKRTSDIDVAELELKGLLEQETPDLAKVEVQAKNVALLQADLRVARIKTIEAGKALLTPEQRGKLERLGQSQRAGHMGMMAPWMGRMSPPIR